MELIRGIHNIRARHHGCVLTIGNFDGVHRGHQKLLKTLREQGHSLNLPVMAMIFEPQPLEFFSPETAPMRLSGLREKTKFLACCGVDYLLCVNFNHQFAQMSAEQFITELLLKKLGVKYLLVGNDFRFGAGKHGDITMLQQAANDFGFVLANEEDVCDDGLRISSTAIRQALAQGDLATAEHLLGRPYAISGRVIHGRALGRTIGFPTANIKYKGVTGVYAVDVFGVEQQPLHGVANIGTRPTVSGKTPLLEVHLLDQKRDLYGSHIEVVLRKKIRDEKRFASIEQLKQQISNDIALARQSFAE